MEAKANLTEFRCLKMKFVLFICEDYTCIKNAALIHYLVRWEVANFRCKFHDMNILPFWKF